MRADRQESYIFRAPLSDLSPKKSRCITIRLAGVHFLRLPDDLISYARRGKAVVQRDAAKTGNRCATRIERASTEEHRDCGACRRVLRRADPAVGG